MSLIVYGDFISPECYQASRYVDALVASGSAVDWRAVEQRPELPVIAQPLSGPEQEATRLRFAELEAIPGSGAPLPWSMPRLMSRTEAAVAAYAEVYPSVVADDVRGLLFELYWRDGVDIGSPTALRTPLAGPVLRAGIGADSMRQTGFAVGMTGAPLTTAAYRRIQAWRAEWRGLGAPPFPVVLVDGATLVEVDAVRRLGKEVRYVGAEPAADVGDPRRYPEVSGRPPVTWVSQVGGRWRHSYRRAVTG